MILALLGLVAAGFAALLSAFRPGTNVRIQESPPPRSVPTDTGVWFTTGLTEKGPLSPVLIRSMAEYLSKFGARVSYGMLYDSLELYFKEGGGRAYISRVVGPSATYASKTLQDGAAANTLTVQAIGPGAYGASLNVQVLAGDVGGKIKLQISHDTDGILETSPDLASIDEAIAWGSYSEHVKLIDEAASALLPAVGAVQSLTGGTDDRNNIVDAQWLNALNLFTKDYGPGQVSAPGRTTDTGHQQLVDHAVDYNRVALLDAPDTNTKATLVASAAGAGTGLDRRWASLIWPWIKVPGLTTGTFRTVPPSAMQAGIIARNDGQGRSKSAPAAGRWGISNYAIGISRPGPAETGLTMADFEDLNEDGIIVVRHFRYGGIKIYGWRSLTSPVTDPNWLDFGHARLAMDIIAKGENIMESYLFAEIDGRGVILSDLKGDLNGMMLDEYRLGSVFGNTPEEAFYVDVGSEVNTPETLAANELHALISLRMSPFAEFAELILVKRPITEAVV